MALACQHLRWELNDMARRLDIQPTVNAMTEDTVPAAASSDSGFTPDGRRMLEAIGSLPEEEREVFDLVRIQGMSLSEAAEVLGVSIRTVSRRLSNGLLQLADLLGDLRPSSPPSESS